MSVSGAPDASVVELHRVGEGDPLVLSEAAGDVWRVDEEAGSATRIEVGDALRIGDTIALSPGASAKVDAMILDGGKRGRAHSFVGPDAFVGSPSRSDVPKLVAELAQLERHLAEQIGPDPLAAQLGPETPFELAMCRDFAVQNLTLAAARQLPEPLARTTRSVALFFHDESACVATSQISVAKIRVLMEALGRPINPHLVDEATLAHLLGLAYDAG